MKKKEEEEEKTYEEDGDPGQADIIKGDGSLERVLFTGPAISVVLIPIDARAVDGEAVHPDGYPGDDAVVAEAPVPFGRRQRTASVHPAVLGQRADVVLLRLLHFVIARQRPLSVCVRTRRFRQIGCKREN